MAPQNIQNSLEKEIPIGNHQFFSDPILVSQGVFGGPKLHLSHCLWLNFGGFPYLKQVFVEGKKFVTPTGNSPPSRKSGFGYAKHVIVPSKGDFNLDGSSFGTTPILRVQLPGSTRFPSFQS